jgi:hypothetical protein
LPCKTQIEEEEQDYEKTIYEILLTLCMVLTLLPATAFAAVESLLPNDPNYVELNQVSNFYKKMQNK